MPNYLDCLIAEYWETSIRPKANNTKNLQAKMRRIVGGAPEVLIKITSFGRGQRMIATQLNYISRSGEVELENDRQQLFTFKDDSKQIAKDWARDLGENRYGERNRDSMHIVLSMPEFTDANAVKSATRDFAKVVFGKNHEYVFALHTDEAHPHCHLCVKMFGFDGRKLRSGREDLRNWRESFAEALRSHGVDAEASPRSVRGVVKKPKKQVIRHIESRQTSKAQALALKEVATRLKERVSWDRPVDVNIETVARTVRKRWLCFANELERSPQLENRKLSEEIKQFVAGMPPTDTEYRKIRNALVEKFVKIKPKAALADIKSADLKQEKYRDYDR